MKTNLLALILCVLFAGGVYAQNNDLHVPTFEEVISLNYTQSVSISPDGKNVLFSVNKTDWEDNSYDNEIWMSKNGQEPFQLTNNPDGSSSSFTWTPDGKFIAFTRRHDDENTIFIMNPEGGEAFPLDYIPESVSQFEFSPDGSTIAFASTEELSEKEKTIDERYGDFEIDNKTYQLNRLFTIPFDPGYAMNEPMPCMQDTTYTTCPDAPELIKHLEEEKFTVSDFSWSPKRNVLAVTHQPDPIITSFMRSDISLYDVNSQELTPTVTNSSADGFTDWAPDGSAFVYGSSVENDTTNFYTNGRYFIYDMESGESREVGADFDENLYNLTWTPKGLFATAYQKTYRNLFLVDPETGDVKEVSDFLRLIYDFSVSDDGNTISLIGRNGDNLNEVYLGDTGNFDFKKLTDFNSQISNWATSDAEVISWKSRDGAEIEGVLHKPQDYDPQKKYPLLVAIHGGPTGISLPSATPGYVYPILQWLDKGALVLEPNYRGSAGYGDDFRSLNVENLGVGDAWDVLSGIDYLAEEGVIDTTMLGSMGWSQGGYISAFLTTYSNRFKAVSVGAGISNWVTYYVNTDIHPFTRQYLNATPWENMDIYEKTSPMTYINNATTPTLIQHGEFDKRVPIPNAYELLQGLEDVGVETKLIVYKGFGHGISKPKERLAATWHNWQWFGKYIWDEDIELPAE